jgi:thioredoxin reductase
VTIIGGDIQGCQLADFLVERRREVTVLESSKSLAAGVAIPRRWRLLQDLRNHGVVMLTGVKFEEITQAGVSITNQEGRRLTIEADSIILTEVIQSNDELLLSLAGRVSQIYPVGDCARLSLIEGAIAGGMIIGTKV